MKRTNSPLLAAAFVTAAAFSAPALSVTDAEFRTLQEQFNQLADAVESQAGNHSRTSVGGYGELHYNNLEDVNGNRSKTLDFHRFVLFFSHEFNDDIRLVSELELEHAFAYDSDTDGTNPDTAQGELELEQAYIEFDLSENLQAKGGLFLIPVGIINETHEPPRFYGVERNPVEKNIIPSTWWEGGVALNGRIGDSGLSYDFAVTSGLNGGVDVRGGRQSVANANAENLAYTGRLKFTGVAGLELAATVNYQTDMDQGTDPTIDSGTLLAAHVIYDIGPVNLRALYAGWDISGAGASAVGKDKQNGYYLESSWKFVRSAGVFARYNVWDNGGAGDTEQTQTDIGINYWPHEDVVIKFDIQQMDNGAANKSAEKDGFNLGIGYQF
jgi:hypothetical protein